MCFATKENLATFELRWKHFVNSIRPSEYLKKEPTACTEMS
ncbi:hypothetical protein VCRA2119O48_200034 [Vibrio crassostreae]|nr:hypothetical protein VCRA2119O48_200034 [Vibrio crassostreae]CAK3224524.1 hypothetical protein VCRA213O314_190068 [Vibrio crassostreae]CAK3837644.1 hypothetical protein VCRA212O16_210035 [Vibrio crassostreae]